MLNRRNKIVSQQAKCRAITLTFAPYIAVILHGRRTLQKRDQSPPSQYEQVKASSPQYLSRNYFSKNSFIPVKCELKFVYIYQCN